MKQDGFEHFERPTVQRHEFPWARRVETLIVSAVVGLLSGALGFALIVNRFDSGSLPLTVVTRQTAASDNQPVAALADQVHRYLLPMYRHRGAADDPFGSLPAPSDYVGSGVAVTSDGWIMAASELLVSGAAYDVMLDGRLLPLSSIRRDPYAHVAFGRIDAETSVPVQLSADFPKPGLLLAAADNRGIEGIDISAAMVSQFPYRPIIVKSDYILDADVLEEFARVVSDDRLRPGGILFGTQGSMAGVLVTIRGVVLLVPSPHLMLSLENMLRGTVALDLGLQYVDYTALPVARDTYGAVVQNHYGIAVPVNSLAFRSGVRPYDIITAVNGVPVSVTQPFGYLWRKHQAEGGVQFNILRAGERIVLDIISR